MGGVSRRGFSRRARLSRLKWRGSGGRARMVLGPIEVGCDPKLQAAVVEPNLKSNMEMKTPDAYLACPQQLFGPGRCQSVFFAKTDDCWKRMAIRRPSAPVGSQHNRP